VNDVDQLNPQDEQAIRAELEQARERLSGLVQQLHAVDRELEDLSGDTQKFRLLGQACGALEELGDLGGAALFWEGRSYNGQADDHLRLVRGRVDEFEKQLSEIDARREDVIDRIQQQEAGAELLEDDLFEIERRREESRLDWVIEREIGRLPPRELVMPWTHGGEDADRFRKALAACLLSAVFFGLVFPLIDLPLPDPFQELEMAERFTSLIREEPPPAPVMKEVKPEEAKPEEQKELAAEEAAPKKTAESKGILAFREKFSGLAASRKSARLGADARISNAGEAKAGRPVRNMVATQGSGSSGGINLASLSRDIGGGGQIEGVEVARVTSSIGGVVGEDRPLSEGPAAGRTDEEIQIVFDRHKAALYRLYNRELRKDPTLRGQMVLRIRIEPDGSVSLCEVKSSDLKAPRLAQRVVERVKTFDFGAKDVATITILYPIDFLPAT